MNEKVTKHLGAYKRSVENKKFQSSAYSILLVFTILVFDIFGLQSMVDITVRRFDALKNLNQLVEDLSYKKDSTDLLKQKLKDSQYYLNILEEVVPLEPKVENYMVSLVQVAAKHGYKQSKLVKRDSRDDYVELRASFQGSPNQMGPFIRSLEAQDRLSVIKSFYYSIVENTVNLEVTVRIFYLYR